MDIVEVPFNQKLGVRRSREGEPGLLALDGSTDNLNHLGTLHAGAQLALAEAASGESLLCQAGLNPETVVAVVRRVEAKFRNPLKGAIFAGPARNQLGLAEALAGLDAQGRAVLPVAVEVTDERHFVGLTATFEWFVQRKAPAG